MLRKEVSPSPDSLLPLPSAAFHILIALAGDDRHGYGIMREVADRTSGRVKLNPGTLYTTIRRLLERGLIEELDEKSAPDDDDERRRYYRLSAWGRKVARAETARLTGILALARGAGLAPERR